MSLPALVDRPRLQRLEQVRVRVDVAAAVVAQVDDHTTRLRPAREPDEPIRDLHRVALNGVVGEVDGAIPVDRRQPLRRAALLHEQRLGTLRHPVEEVRIRGSQRGHVRAGRNRCDRGVGRALDREHGARGGGRDPEPVQDLRRHEVGVAVRGARQRVVVGHERIDEPEHVRDRLAVDRDEFVADELRAAGRGDDVDAVRELVCGKGIEVEHATVVGERVHVRVAVTLAEERDQPEQLDHQLVVVELREARDQPVGGRTVVRLGDRVVRARVDALELCEVQLDVRGGLRRRSGRQPARGEREGHGDGGEEAIHSVAEYSGTEYDRQACRRRGPRPGR